MLKLHFAPNSRAGRIVWLLEELGLEYDLNAMAFHPKDLKSDEHRKRHPLGLEGDAFDVRRTSGPSDETPSRSGRTPDPVLPTTTQSVPRVNSEQNGVSTSDSAFRFSVQIQSQKMCMDHHRNNLSNGIHRGFCPKAISTPASFIFSISACVESG